VAKRFWRRINSPEAGRLRLIVVFPCLAVGAIGAALTLGGIVLFFLPAFHGLMRAPHWLMVALFFMIFGLPAINGLVWTVVTVRNRLDLRRS